eukprot:7254284-Alexandrium_andersonii.AAC.1
MTGHTCRAGGNPGAPSRMLNLAPCTRTRHSHPTRTQGVLSDTASTYPATQSTHSCHTETRLDSLLWMRPRNWCSCLLYTSPSPRD